MKRLRSLAGGWAVGAAKVRGRAVAEWLLGGSLTGGVTRFFKSLGVVGVWYAAARVVAAGAAILAARLLGADAFGNAQLAMNVAQVFSTLAVVGLNTAMIRYGARAENPREFTATAWWVVVGVNAGFFLCWAVASPWLAGILQVTTEMFWFGLGIALPLTLYVALSAVQQTTGAFKQRGLTEFILAVGTLLVLPVGYIAFGKSYKASAGAYLGGYVLAVVLAFAMARPYLALGAVRSHAIRAMGPYAWYNFLCGVGFLLTSSIQRPILKHYLSSSDVGLYGLYFAASIGMAAYAGTILTTVFFPSAAKSSDRAGLWRVTLRAWSKVVGILWVALAAAQVGFVLLSGKDEFPLDPKLVALFATAACIMMVQSTMGQIVGAEGVRGAKLGVIMSLAVGFLNVGLSLYLIPRLHVHGAVLSLVLVYSLALWVLYLVRNRYL